MTESEQYERIEAYLEKRLHPEAVAETEALLLEDASFAALFRKHQAAYRLLEVSAIDRVIREAGREEPEAPVRPLRVSRRWLPLVAAVAGILVLCIPYFYATSQFSSRALAHSHYAVYGLPGVRGGASADEVQALLATGKYEEAIPLLQAVPIADPGYLAARMQLGNALFQTHRFSDAAIAFGQVARSGDVRFAPAATWYVALCQLGAGNEAAARAALQEMAENETHAYREKARELLARLDSIWRKWPGVH